MSGFDNVRTRLLLLVILAILPSLVLFLVTGGEQTRRSAADAQAEALRLTRIVAAEQELQIQGARQLLIALAQLPAIQHRQPKACEDILAKIAPHFPAYTGMSAIYPSGEVFCNSAPTDRAINISDRDYYQRLLETRDFSMSGYLIGHDATGSAVIIFVYPAIESTTGDLQAIVLAALDLTWLDQMAQSLQ